MFWKKKAKKVRYDNPVEDLYNRLEDGEFHRLEDRLYWKKGEKLLCCDILIDDNSQYFMYPKTSSTYESPWLEKKPMTEEEKEEYQTRTLMWLASLGKYVILVEEAPVG